MSGVHVLYVIDSLVRGGAEQSLAAVAPHYAARGIALDVASLHERPGLQDELRAAGAVLFSLAGRGGRAGWVRRARRLIAERRPDLVHTTLLEADVAGRIAATLARVPVVSSLVNDEHRAGRLGDPSLAWWKVRGTQLLDALTARRVVRFHAVNRSVAAAMSRRLRIPPERIDVVPRGRDPGALGTRAPERRRRARAALGVGDGTPVLLAAARHEYQKGLDVLLEALALVRKDVPGVRLFVAGREGNQTSRLRSHIGRLGLEGVARFLGVRSDVPDLLCAADAFVLPSRWEGHSGVLLEAMALETPIVASDMPAVREVVGDEECGRLVPPERPDALAAGIVAALGDPGPSGRTRPAHERFLRLFTVDRVAGQMVAFYERALAAAGRREGPPGG